MEPLYVPDAVSEHHELNEKSLRLVGILHSPDMCSSLVIREHWAKAGSDSTGQQLFTYMSTANPTRTSIATPRTYGVLRPYIYCYSALWAKVLPRAIEQPAWNFPVTPLRHCQHLFILRYLLSLYKCYFKNSLVCPPHKSAGPLNSFPLSLHTPLPFQKNFRLDMDFNSNTKDLWNPGFCGLRLLPYSALWAEVLPRASDSAWSFPVTY